MNGKGEKFDPPCPMTREEAAADAARLYIKLWVENESDTTYLN
jgi:hypothetical protein